MWSTPAAHRIGISASRTARAEAALEAVSVLLREERLREAEARGVRRDVELGGGSAEHRGAERSGVGGVLGLEKEEARGASVVLLGDGANLPRAHDVDEAGFL